MVRRFVTDRGFSILGRVSSSSLATGTATAFVLASALASMLFDLSLGASAPWTLRGPLASLMLSTSIAAPALPASVKKV